MSEIEIRLKKIHQQIETTLQRYHRSLGTVKLLLVSKGQSVEKIRMAHAAGQYCFAENYLQEAIKKMNALSLPDIEWHFIGSIQSNKTKQIAQRFSWVQSISSLKIAERLNAKRPENFSPLNVCIEVNIDSESSKTGINPRDCFDLARKIAKLPRLKLRGLMIIPKESFDFACQRQAFKQAYDLFVELRSSGLELDTLSMGMSNDFEAAIAEGATCIRIGRAVFGSREEINE